MHNDQYCPLPSWQRIMPCDGGAASKNAVHASEIHFKRAHKQTDKQTNNQTIKPSINQTIKHSNNQTIKQSNKQTNKQTNNQTNKQTNKHGNTETQKHTPTHIYIYIYIQYLWPCVCRRLGKLSVISVSPLASQCIYHSIYFRSASPDGITAGDPFIGRWATRSAGRQKVCLGIWAGPQRVEVPGLFS